MTQRTRNRIQSVVVRSGLAWLMVVSVSLAAYAVPTLSKQRIEEVRSEATDIHSTYETEIQKPAAGQSRATFEQLQKRIDDIWSDLNKASGMEENFAGLYRDLHRIYSRVSNRDSPETWSVWVDTRRKEEAEAARERHADKLAVREAARRREAEKRAALEAVQGREAAIFAKGWGHEGEQSVIARKVFVGMTAEQARMAWGPPERINETIRASGRVEQWVYGSGRYLYFGNGRLTTIQRSR